MFDSFVKFANEQISAGNKSGNFYTAEEAQNTLEMVGKIRALFQKE